jgi:two-component system sensor histidine kinase DegS
LAAAVRWFLNDVRKHTDINIHFNIAGEENSVDDAIKITVYRVVQEATTNVLKHADAKNFYVDINFEADQLSIEARDDGIGIAPGTLERQSQHSWGLMGMQERVSLLDGEFRIDSSPNVGTKITISIPYHPHDKQLHTSNEGMTNDN